MTAGVQKSWNALSPAERVRRRASVAVFNKNIDKNSYYAGTKRFGCIDYGPTDAEAAAAAAAAAAGPSTAQTVRKKKRKFTNFYDHQVIAAHHLIKLSTDLGYVQRKGTGLLFNHAPGLGKTHAALAAMATVKLCAVPEGVEGKALIIAPLTVFKHWRNCTEEAVDFSNNFTSEAEKARRGKGVLFARRHQELTLDAIDRAELIVTTPTAIAAAYQTYRLLVRIPYRTKGGHLRHKKEWQNRKDKKTGHTIPMHPFFRFLFKHRPNGLPAFSIVIADELPIYSNPASCVGKVVQYCTEQSVYVVALSGAPARARPKQMADLCKTASWTPSHFGDPREWGGKGDTCIKRSTINDFHARKVDRADETTVSLPPETLDIFPYGPAVGLEQRASPSAPAVFDTAQQRRHNGWLAWAQLQAQQAQQDPDMAAHYERVMWRGISKMINYSSDSTLGDYLAKGFKSHPEECYRKALLQPSNLTEITLKTARKAFQHGITKIMMYSHSATTLQIIYNQALDQGGCGKLLRYMGGTEQQRRDEVLEEFLGDPDEHAILFISSAGSIGTNVAPGCWTVFVVGDLPYNNACLKQAVSRVRRVDQPDGTEIQIVLFEPRFSLTSAKMLQHVDKRDRLELALNCGDFSKFDPEQNERWRLSDSLVSDLTLVDDRGNYGENNRARETRTKYEAECRTARLEGKPAPECPREARVMPLLLHDEMTDDDLPIIRFGTRDPKVDGPLEMGPDPYNPDCEGAIFKDRVVSRLNPKGMLPRPAPKRAAANGKKKKKPSTALPTSDELDTQVGQDGEEEFVVSDGDEDSGEESEDEAMDEDSEEEEANESDEEEGMVV